MENDLEGLKFKYFKIHPESLSHGASGDMELDPEGLFQHT